MTKTPNLPNHLDPDLRFDIAELEIVSSFGFRNANLFLILGGLCAFARDNPSLIHLIGTKI
jgi:hypothetical protein